VKPATHTVTIGEKTFTRKSHRTYTHAVVLHGITEAAVRRDHAAYLKTQRESVLHYQAIADNANLTTETREKAAVAAGKLMDDIAAMTAGLEERIRQQATKVYVDRFCTTERAAQSGARTLRWQGRYTLVTVEPVQRAANES
jgi:hypothetical protein